MPDRIRVGIVGATVTQGGSGWGPTPHVPSSKLYPSTSSRRSAPRTKTPRRLPPRRSADTLRSRGSFDVDFDLAVRRHKLIDAIGRSSATGRTVTLAQ